MSGSISTERAGAICRTWARNSHAALGFLNTRRQGVPFRAMVPQAMPSLDVAASTPVDIVTEYCDFYMRLSPSPVDRLEVVCDDVVVWDEETC